MTRSLALGLVWLLFAAPVLHAQGEEAAAGDPASRRTAEKLKNLHEEADRLATQERGILNQLRQLQLARQIANEELKQANAATTVTAAERAALDDQVTRLESERDAERPKLESRLVEMYKLGQGRYLRLLLSASDVGQIGQASRTVAALAAADEQRVLRYERRLTELADARQSLSSRQTELNTKTAAAARAQQTASRAIAAQAALVREIDERRDLNAQLASELMASQVRLNNTLRSVPASTASTAPAAAAAGPVRGSLPWPATGPVPRQSGSALAQRPGVTISVPEGVAVNAVHDGTVAFAGSFDGLGNLVIVDHGNQTFTLYGYLMEMAVGQGAHVVERQTVGRAGTSPTGIPLLYFELRVNGHPVDPLQWLERTR